MDLAVTPNLGKSLTFSLEVQFTKEEISQLVDDMDHFFENTDYNYPMIYTLLERLMEKL
jgi:hypothetical protein